MSSSINFFIYPENSNFFVMDNNFTGSRVLLPRIYQVNRTSNNNNVVIKSITSGDTLLCCAEINIITVNGNYYDNIVDLINNLNKVLS